MIPSLKKATIERIKKHEGFRSTGYLDSLGFATIGFGTHEIEEDDAEYLLLKQFNRLEKDVCRYLEAEEISLDEFRIGILIEMAYQLGYSGLLKFKKMFEALRSMDYDTASAEMLNSKWHKQTPVRAERLAKMMEVGA